MSDETSLVLRRVYDRLAEVGAKDEAFKLHELMQLLWTREDKLEQLVRGFVTSSRQVEDASNCDEDKHRAWHEYNNYLLRRARELLEVSDE